MSFGGDVANYANKTRLGVNRAIVSICSQAATSVIKRTPVDEGRARSNWIATIGTPSNIEVEEIKSQSVVIAEAKAIAKQAAGNIFWLTNNLDYIGTIEFGGYPKNVKFGTRLKNRSKKTQKSGVMFEVRSAGGYSIQAPAGMVRITAEEIDKQLKNFARG